MTAAALFEIATGLVFLTVLYVGVFARPAIRPLGGRLQAFGILLIAVGLFLVYEGLGRGDENMLIGGAAAFVLAAIMVAVGLAMSARRAG
jgi:hydrogenase-4 membrane subunit HyfE